jgi:hypothetical protein
MAIAEQEIIGTKLPLDSLEIKNYRAFKELTIPKLARVNLITGKNSVGKTSLLEAVYLYMSDDLGVGLRRVLDDRDQLRQQMELRPLAEMEAEIVAQDSIRTLFYAATDRPAASSREFAIGPLGALERQLRTQVIPYAGEGIVGQPTPSSSFTRVDTLYLHAKKNGSTISLPVRVALMAEHRPLTEFDETSSCKLISSSGLSHAEVGLLWDLISLTSLEPAVISAVQILDDRIQRINLRGEPTLGERRVPMVSLGTLSDPVPLRVLGEGVNRVFWLGLGLTSVGGGVLLVDEIENGLHHSIQTQVWRAIFDLAQRLNVQVFATTHSWDCVTAFQKALADVDEREGLVINLRQKSGKMVTTTFDKRDLGIVVEDGIEVR